jgi:hypothetical protein
MLAILINRAKLDGQIDRVVPHLVDDGLSILHANDTIIFLDHGSSKAKHLKLLLCAFEQLSCLKINFRRSEVFYFGEVKEMQDEYSNIFGCQGGTYPFRYLGIPMYHRKLNNNDWKVIEQWIEKN